MAILASDSRVTGSLTAAWNGTGTEPANTCVTVEQPANGCVAFQITSIPSATLTFEATVDGSTWVAASALRLSTKLFVLTATATGVYFVNFPGANRIRARSSTFASGPVVLTAAGTVAELLPYSLGASGGGGPVTIADGADVAQGTTTDAGVVTDTTGTVIGFLRGAIVKWVNFLSRIPAALIGGRLDVNVGAIPATISVVNSTVATLGNGAVFTGTGEDVSAYASIAVSVKADQVSATGGLSFQFSTDNTNWDVTQAVTVALNVSQMFVLSPVAQFFRVVYTNGATPQTAFRLESIYRAVATNLANAAFQDVNATLSPTYIGQRLAADMMLQDASGGLTNRIRSAADLVNAGAGVGGGTHIGAALATYDSVGAKFHPAKGFADGTLLSGGFTTVLTTTLTRPADTTAYTAGDEMTDTGGAIQTITGAARFSGGSGAIQGIYVSQSTLWTTKPSMEIWVYDTTSTPVADNGAFAPTDGVTDTCIAVIPLTLTYAGTVNQALDSGSINIPYLTVGSANLFFRVVIRNAAQDSANSGVSKFRFRLAQD